MCPPPDEIPGMFTLTTLQIVPLWATILILGFISFALIVIAFRIIRLFQRLARGQELRSLVWLQVLSGACLGVWGLCMGMLLLWLIAFSLWFTPEYSQCAKQGYVLFAHPGNVVGLIVVPVAFMGMGVLQLRYGHLKSKLIREESPQEGA